MCSEMEVFIYYAWRKAFHVPRHANVGLGNTQAIDFTNISQVRTVGFGVIKT